MSKSKIAERDNYILQVEWCNVPDIHPQWNKLMDKLLVAPSGSFTDAIEYPEPGGAF